MSKSKKSVNTLKRAYQLYISGLNREEIERLLKHDAQELYAYYSKDVLHSYQSEINSPISFLRFIKDLFVSFILKLTPARRAFYMVSLILFIWGMTAAQNLYSIAAFILLSLLLALELADKLRTKSELEFAREIQISLLPQIPPKIENLNTVAFTETALEVGGDYYDWFRLKNGQILFVIGDVSGKGITAALYMVRLQGFIQMLIKENLPVRQLLSRLNQLCKAQLKRNFFVTLATVLYTPGSGEIRVCRAGHNPVLYYSQEKQKCYRIEPSGLALGLEKNGKFEATLEQVKTFIKPGDLLFLYTDGLNETLNKNLEMFSEKRIETIIRQFNTETPETLKSIFLKEVVRFRANQPIHDDLTFLIIKAD